MTLKAKKVLGHWKHKENCPDCGHRGDEFSVMYCKCHCNKFVSEEK
jgi:hypothetical protein